MHLSCLLQVDVIAGISVGAMVVPQGMSYAKLAGLPNVYGLYGAFVPVLIYAALGSSPQLVRSGIVNNTSHIHGLAVANPLTWTQYVACNEMTCARQGQHAHAAYPPYHQLKATLTMLAQVSVLLQTVGVSLVNHCCCRRLGLWQLHPCFWEVG